MQGKNKKLDEYFKAARQQEPALPLDVVRTQLQHTAATSAATTTGKGPSVLSGKAITVIATGVVGTALVGGLLWNSIKEQQPLQKEIAAEVTEHEILPAEPQLAEIIQPVAAPDTIGVRAKATPAKAALTGATNSKVASSTLPVAASGNGGKTSIGATAPQQPAADKANKEEPVFRNITLVELPAETLRKMNINVTEEGIFYQSVVEDGAGDAGKKMMLQVKVSNNVHEIIVGASTDATTTTFLPVFISERSGKQRVAYRLPNETRRKFEKGYFNEVVNSLVPVLIKANNAAKDEVILWFEPTPAFLSLLPSNISNEIDKEYKQLQENKDATTQLAKADSIPSNNNKQQPGESIVSAELLNAKYKYFESGSSNLTSIKYAVIYPNPAKEYVQLSVGLKRDETLRVSLVDINGRLVKTLSDFKSHKAGTLSEQFNIQGTQPGLYLVVTETKSGSRHAQRIIIQ